MKQECKRFTISTLIVVIGVFLADMTMNVIGKVLYTNMPDFATTYAKINYVANRAEPDVVCLGSSRAYHHFVPSILEDSLSNITGAKHSVYNAGMDGWLIDGNTCLIECILERCSPELIILEVNDGELYANTKTKLLELAPFYRDNKIVTKYLNQLDFKTYILMHSALYRYKLKIVRILSSYITKTNANDGYAPAYGEMTKEQAEKKLEKNQEEKHYTETNSNQLLQELKENSLRYVMRLCKKKGIKLIITTSPRYGMEASNVVVMKMCKKEGIPYIDMESSEYFNSHPELFYDVAHLNDNGAKKYSTIFMERVKPYLLSN